MSRVRDNGHRSLLRRALVRVPSDSHVVVIGQPYGKNWIHHFSTLASPVEGRNK